MEVNNYRPTFTLSNCSIIFKKLVAARLTKFLKKHNILHGNQYGFYQNLSTAQARLDVINGISINISKNQYTDLFFHDLKKVFNIM